MSKPILIIAAISIVCISCTGAGANNNSEIEKGQNNMSLVPDIVTKDYTKGLDKDDQREIWFKIVDINGDGVPEIVYFCSGACGNTGCTGSIYTEKEGGYCYAGDIHEKDLTKNTKGRLDCFLGTKGILRSVQNETKHK